MPFRTWPQQMRFSVPTWFTSMVDRKVTVAFDRTSMSLDGATSSRRDPCTLQVGCWEKGHDNRRCVNTLAERDKRVEDRTRS